MKNFSQILNLLLAIALIIMAINAVLKKPEATKSENQEQITGNALDVIMQRTSIRSYTDKPLKPETADQLLKAAMAAPTAANKQPWAFIVVDDRSLLEKIAATQPHGKMVANAQMAIVSCGDLSKSLEGDAADFWIQDVSAATENILLAAHSLGLGAVWVGVYPMAERVESIKTILSLPQHIIPLAIIPVGYPDGTFPPKDKWKPENIYRNQWEANDRE